MVYDTSKRKYQHDESALASHRNFGKYLPPPRWINRDERKPKSKVWIRECVECGISFRTNTLARKHKLENLTHNVISYDKDV